MVLTEEESGGVLTERIVASGLSNLELVPSQPNYAFTQLQLNGKARPNTSTGITWLRFIGKQV
jgi:hypothetical protein